jgi:hypothetical protein
MEYSGGILKLMFRKTTGVQVRTYEDVPSETAHKLYYKNTAKDVLRFFAKEIKKKFKIKSVNQK